METMKDFYDENSNTFAFEPNSKEFWEKMLEYKNNKTILTGKVVGLNFSGLIVDYEGFRMFMPSQMVSLKKSASFEQYLENNIDFVVVNLDPKKESVKISHREIELLEMKKAREEKINAISVGKSYEGTVESVKDYGAFIKIDEDVVGLCHISQVSHNKIKKLDSVLKVGDNVRVKVIKNENGKISLSIKALEKNESEEKEMEAKNYDYKNLKLHSGDATTSLGDLLDFISLN